MIPLQPKWLFCFAVSFSACASAACAQSSPMPSPSASVSPAASASPEPSPSPTQVPGSVRWTVDAHTTFISQGTSGPGLSPPEGPRFAQGDPLSPETPYELFSSAAMTPGNAGEAALYVRPTYAAKTVDLSLTAGLGYARGSVTNALYWGESLFPTINSHLGAQVLPYGIVFPTHAGNDNGTGLVASILSGTLATKDGAFVLKGGWFDLTQTDPFVFVQPALSNLVPAIGIATPETLGDGPPSLDAWTPSSPVLPLHGIDAVYRHGLATIEAADASLPTLPGTPARMKTVSIVVDHGEGTKYTFQYLHVGTGGDLVPTTILYGADPHIESTSQGPLAYSTIGSQRQRIFGASAAFHLRKSLDGIVEIGHSTYDADNVAKPGTGSAGNYYHVGLSHAFGSSKASLDLFRNEAYYANILLPYGIPENVWSISYSWPGQWLKSNYQLINDYPVNIDRQGFRVKYNFRADNSPLDVRLSYANFAQINPITYSNALTAGFIDGFFLPQPDNAATLGRQQQYGFYLGYHPGIFDITFDYAEDTMHRPASPSHPEDYVAYDSPEMVLTLARHINRRLLATAGFARYGMRGNFGTTSGNVDFGERILFGGLQFAESPHATSLLSVRRTTFGGIPTMPGGPLPDFMGTTLVFEQRFRF